MSILRSRTDPRWVGVALSDLDATLGDHAHCEKKAAATAVKLVADHADRPDLVRKLAKLAQEETQHPHAGVEPRDDALPPFRGQMQSQLGAAPEHIFPGPRPLLISQMAQFDREDPRRHLRAQVGA